MKWKKLGKIFDHKSFNLCWFKRMAMVPVPYQLNASTIRLFATFCDEHNVGRIGFVDLDIENPRKILNYSHNPIIDTGRAGTFDSQGVVTASVLDLNDKLIMFYSGYQLTSSPPYMIFSGAAESKNGGETFEKITTDVPLLDRIENEYNTRCVPTVLKDGNLYRMWYAADAGERWIKTEKKYLPEYELKYAESDDPLSWRREPGASSVVLKNDYDEHGITRCTVWKEDERFKMLYSIRSRQKQYRIGYGESRTGVSFERKDEDVGIDVSSKGWDSKMIAFPGVIKIRNRMLMFYCGNSYGLGGIGVAERTD